MSLGRFKVLNHDPVRNQFTVCVKHLIKERTTKESLGMLAVFSDISFSFLLSFVKVRESGLNVCQLLFYCVHAILGWIKRKESGCPHTNLNHKNISESIKTRQNLDMAASHCFLWSTH